MAYNAYNSESNSLDMYAGGYYQQQFNQGHTDDFYQQQVNHGSTDEFYQQQVNHGSNDDFYQEPQEFISTAYQALIPTQTYQMPQHQTPPATYQFPITAPTGNVYNKSYDGLASYGGYGLPMTPPVDATAYAANTYVQNGFPLVQNSTYQTPQQSVPVAYQPPISDPSTYFYGQLPQQSVPTAYQTTIAAPTTQVYNQTTVQSVPTTYQAPIPAQTYQMPQQLQPTPAAYQATIAAATGNARSKSFDGLASYGGYSLPVTPPVDATTYASTAYTPEPDPTDVNNPDLIKKIEEIVQSFNDSKRPVMKRQVITIPSCTPGRISCITRRLPTPPPDVIERITIVKPQRDLVNLNIEKPIQPPPCLKQTEVPGQPSKPIIQPRVISVPPRSTNCQQSQAAQLRPEQSPPVQQQLQLQQPVAQQLQPNTQQSQQLYIQSQQGFVPLSQINYNGPMSRSFDALSSYAPQTPINFGNNGMALYGYGY